jgi:predicted nucleic acid-binding protein
MVYVDTAVLVSALTIETTTQRAQAWLARQPLGGICVSNWTITEFSAALSIKQRTGQMTVGERTSALATFTGDLLQAVEVLAVSDYHFRQAAKLADTSLEGLRAGDALHLAVCIDRNLSLCTLDRRLVRAGTGLGAEMLFP